MFVHTQYQHLKRVFGFCLFWRLCVKPFSHCQMMKEENLCFLKFCVTTAPFPWAVRCEGEMIKKVCKESITRGLMGCLGPTMGPVELLCPAGPSAPGGWV